MLTEYGRALLTKFARSLFLVAYFTTLSVANLLYIGPNGKMSVEWWTGKDLEWRGRGVIDPVSAIFVEELRKTTKSLRLGRDSNRAPPEYEFKTLPLRQTTRWYGPKESTERKLNSRSRSVNFMLVHLRSMEDVYDEAGLWSIHPDLLT
jgi:hypothetical protein